MSISIQFVTHNVAGYESANGRTFPCSAIPGKAISVSSCFSDSYNKTISGPEFTPLKSSSRRKFLVCNAGTGGYRRNPEFSRQNKFSRNRNRKNEDNNNSDSVEESELYPRNGPLLSMSGATRFQAAAKPGPREKEIVELFRKVQAQLRERAAVKEEKKKEELSGQGKESETVDSLLKLLRKHTNQQVKKSSNNTSVKDFILDESKQNGTFGAEKSTISSVFVDGKDEVQIGKKSGNNASSRDFIVDEAEQNGVFNGEKSTISSGFLVNGKDEVQELEPTSFTRPASNFRRRSPVPRVKFHPFDSDSVTETYVRPKKEVNKDEELEIETETKLEIEPVLGFSEDDVASDDEDDYSDEEEEEEEEDSVELIDYNAMKLTELRALAKSRGVKGFSKLKKAELAELLSGSSM